MQKVIIAILLLIVVASGYSQEVKQDSTKVQNIEEVVVTAQYEQQAINKAVQDVTVINSTKIAQNAANNLADLLNQNLNIQIIPNTKEGKSKVSLFGLDGQYFKILEDGIPMVSEDGFGNNMDLTQINLDNVAQIEIVEGAMGVSYGANAVSGVINIITKKNIKTKWKASATIQEETVGNEYELWAKGRHIAGVNITRQFNKFYINALYSRNNFTGFSNNYQGKNYIVDDGLRGYDWLPKEQQFGKGTVRYNGNKLQLTYKIGVFNELLNQYNSAINTTYNSTLNAYDKKTNDRNFVSNRLTNDLTLTGKLKNNIRFNTQLAYQKQSKKYSDIIYDLYTRTSLESAYEEYLSRETYFGKTVFNHFVQNKPYDYELGFEYNLENGYGAAVASQISTVNTRNSLSSFAAFSTLEYKLTDKLKLRGGLRYTNNSKFQNQLNYSFNARYLLPKNIETRLIIGSSFRTPNFDELYTFFVDANHNVTGNEDLTPEKSFSVFYHLKKRKQYDNGAYLVNKIKLGYITVNDKIDLAIIATTPQLAYKYININKFETRTVSSNNSFKHNNFTAQLGASITGLKQSQYQEVNSDYMYTLQLNAGLSYRIPKINTQFALSYKYNGKQESYFLDSDDNYVKETTEAFNWADCSIKKSFLSNKLHATLGVRNLFNVIEINNTSDLIISGTHSANNRTTSMGYGRSYFFKLNYNL